MRNKNLLFQKFVNITQKKGKKQKTYKIMLICFKEIKKVDKRPLNFFEKAIENVTPVIGVSLKKKYKNQLVTSINLSHSQRITLGIKWLIIGAIKDNKKANFYCSLSHQILNAYRRSGCAFDKKINYLNLIEKSITR